MTNDPVDIAIELLDQLEASPKSAAAQIRNALEATADHGDVVASILDWLEQSWPLQPVRPELWHVLSELGARLTGIQACRSLGYASEIAAITDDDDIAFSLAVDALGKMPTDHDAFVRCREFAEPDRLPVVADALERLARKVHAGAFPAQVFNELLAVFESAGRGVGRSRAI